MSGNTAHLTMCNTQWYRTHDYTLVCHVFKQAKQKTYKKYVCKEPNNLRLMNCLSVQKKKQKEGEEPSSQAQHKANAI